MRNRALIGMLVVAGCVGVATGEPTPLPVSTPVMHVLESPVTRANTTSWGVVVHHEQTIPGASWLRAHLEGTALPPGAVLRITSIADGEEQELDAEGLRAWDFQPAYFNGDTLRFEILAEAPLEPGSARLVLTQLEVGPIFDTRGGPGQCGICIDDSRTPSTELWVARLMPGPCTASIICANSTALTAGHCGGGNTIQFRVPNSTAGCAMNMPPVAEQFPVVRIAFQNAGVGADWAVFAAGVNSLGQRPFDRYGVYGLVASAPPAASSSAVAYGYGADTTCIKNQTQQASPGSILSATTSTIFHDCDVRGGNSGSPVLVGGRIAGVVTHCDGKGCGNVATTVTHTPFAAAIAGQTCPTSCDTLDFNRDTFTPDSLDLDDFVAVLGGGPTACSNFPSCGDLDFNNDGLFPDSTDLDAFVSRLGGGACVQ